MPRTPKPPRTDTAAQPPPLATPFASLDLTGLPDAPPPPDTPPAKAPPAPKLVLRREKSGRGGKRVLVVSGFPRTWHAPRIAEFATRLKRALGTGGCAEGGTIEIQGDDPARLRSLLEAEGFRVAGP